MLHALNGPQLEEQLPYNLPWRSNGVIIHPSDNAASPNDVTEIATCCNGIYIVNIEDDNSLHDHTRLLLKHTVVQSLGKVYE